MESYFDLGRKFAEISMNEQRELARCRRVISGFDRLHELEFNEMNRYLLEIQPQLDNCFGKLNEKTQEKLAKEGYLSKDPARYCVAAQSLIKHVKAYAWKKIDAIEKKIPDRMDQVEKWFINGSESNRALLENMRCRPN